MLRFMNLPEKQSVYSSSKYVIIPVPIEGKPAYGTGSCKGPAAVLSASQELDLYDMETDSEPFEEGIFTHQIVRSKSRLRKEVSKVVADSKFPLILGGDHSITAECAEALKREITDITFLQLDAHVDLWDEFDGDRYSHACVMRRVSELGIPLVQVGIRSMDIEEKYYAKRIRSRVFTAQDIFDDLKWMDKVVSSLNKKVYITIDVDVFDPSIMPSTGTPEPGGLLWYQVLGLLRKVFSKKNVIGADIVELAPIKGMHAADFTIAKLAYKLVAYGKESR